jgi:hypothetical protein
MSFVDGSSGMMTRLLRRGTCDSDRPHRTYQLEIKALVSRWHKAIAKDGDCRKIVPVNKLCDHSCTKFQLFLIIFG